MPFGIPLLVLLAPFPFAAATKLWAPSSLVWASENFLPAKLLLLLFSALWTGDPSGGKLNLRASGEHTHFYHRDDAAQQAGHYHGDVTPEEVHYRGFFNLADQIVRFGDIYDELGLKP